MISKVVDLVSSKVLFSLSGFLFWWVAARTYSVEEIGIGAFFISLSSLVIFPSSLLVASFPRFLPANDRQRNVLLSLSAVSAGLYILFLAIVILTSWALNSGSISILRSPFLILGFSVLTFSMFVFQSMEKVFLGLRKTKLLWVNNFIQNYSRILLLVVFSAYGGIGVFYSNNIAAVFSCVFCVLVGLRLLSGIPGNSKVDVGIIKTVIPYSLTNFLNGSALALPGMVYPLIISSVFSKEAIGYFYIPWMIFFACGNIVQTVLNVFLVEALNQGEFNKLPQKVIWILATIVCGGLLIGSFGGEFVLGFFKKEFSVHSSEMMKWLFFSLPFFALNQVYLTMMNLKHEVKKHAIVSIIVMIILILTSFLFIQIAGVVGVAFSWFVTNGIGALLVGLLSLNGYSRNIKKPIG